MADEFFALPPELQFAAAGTILVIVLFLFLIGYLYNALVLMTIGKKTKTGPIWLAWIPIVNMFYVPILAGYKWYFGFLWLLSLVPLINSIAVIGLTIWWWWKISEKRNKPGWFGILMVIPIVNIVIMALIAWKD